MSVSQVQAALAATPTADGRLVVLRNWVRQQSDEAIDSMGGQKAVEKQVIALYDAYITPLDLPGIPALAEPAVDAVLKRLISALIWAVDDDGETR
jgi:hypothetical protein